MNTEEAHPITQLNNKEQQKEIKTQENLNRSPNSKQQQKRRQSSNKIAGALWIHLSQSLKSPTDGRNEIPQTSLQMEMENIKLKKKQTNPNPSLSPATLKGKLQKN